MNIPLTPFVWLVGWLVMRDLEKWAKTPHLFDTTPQTFINPLYLIGERIDSTAYCGVEFAYRDYMKSKKSSKRR